MQAIPACACCVRLFAAAETTLICLLALFRGSQYVVENPESSLIHAHPRFAMLISLHPSHVVKTYLGSFGGATPKPIKLWSSHVWGPVVFSACRGLFWARCAVLGARRQHASIWAAKSWPQALARGFKRSNFSPSNGKTGIKYTDHAGRQRMKGGPQLKQSQVYPDMFGEAAWGLNIWKRHHMQLPVSQGTPNSW